MPMSRKPAKAKKKMPHAALEHGHGARDMHHVHTAKKPHHAGHAPMRKMSAAVKRGK